MGRKMLDVGRCGLCGVVAGLVQDHSYASGLCRDKICPGCNVRVGRYEARHDDRVVSYVARWAGTHAAGLGVRYTKEGARTAAARDRTRLLHLARRRQRRRQG